MKQSYQRPLAAALAFALLFALGHVALDHAVAADHQDDCQICWLNHTPAALHSSPPIQPNHYRHIKTPGGFTAEAVVLLTYTPPPRGPPAA